MYIERRRPNGKWECIADDEQVMDRFHPCRYYPLFAMLSYNDYEGKEGVKQKPFKDWISTISPETFKYLFFLVDKPITDHPALYSENFIRDLGFYEYLETGVDDSNSDDDDEEEEYIAEYDDALRWLQDVSFLLTDNIISNPDACYINWCSADELEWAVKQMRHKSGHKLSEDEGYLKVVRFMREQMSDGYEVRVVYAYDNTTPWLNQDKKRSEEKESEEDSEEDSTEEPNNLLLMYLLQNKAKELIELIEAEKNRCFFGILSLYQVAYANKILLADNNWKSSFLPMVKNLRIENERILRFIESIITIPSNYDKSFMEALSPFSFYDGESDLVLLLDGELSDLVAMGYREIDCRLYAAGITFNFDRMIDLLNQGANPYAHISGDYTPDEAAQMEPYEVNSLYDDAVNRVCDCCDFEGICACWKDGIDDKETKVSDDLLRSYFQAAGYQIVADIIRKYSSNSK